MFPNIFKLYKSVWKSMIQPPRVEYSEDHLGQEIGNINGVLFRKEVHHIKNIKGQKIRLTLYIPGSQPVDIKLTQRQRIS